MGLDDLVRGAVEMADDITTSLQVTVTHAAWTGQSLTGVPTFATTSRLALIEERDRVLRNPQGEVIVSSHKLTFLRPIAANGAANRTEPIDPRDKFTLPNGKIGRVVDVRGMTDPNTSQRYFFEVYLGA